MGQKSNITKANVIDYYAKERMKPNDKTIISELDNIMDSKAKLKQLLSISFLSSQLKKAYSELMESRYGILFD